MHPSAAGGRVAPLVGRSHPRPLSGPACARGQKEVLMSVDTPLQPATNVDPERPMHHNASQCITSGNDDASNPTDLNEKKRAAIELIARGTSYRQAAKALSVDRTTVYRWRQDAAFQQRLE